MITATKNTSLKAPVASVAHYTLTAYFEEQSSSEANNTSKILARTTLAVDNTSSFSGSNNGTLQIYWYDNNNYSNGLLIASRTIDSLSAGTSSYIHAVKDISHKADGTLSGYAKAVWTKLSSNTAVPVSGNVSTNNTTLTAIARKSSITITKGGYDIADNYVLIDIGRKSSSYTDTVTWTCSNLSETVQTKGSATKIMLCFDNNSYNNITAPSGYTKKRSTYSNTDIMNKITSAKSINMTFTTTTYNGNTSLGSTSSTFTYNVYKTTYANNLAYRVSDTLSVNLTGATDKVIKGVSNVYVSNIATKLLNDNSTISTYKFAISSWETTITESQVIFSKPTGNVIAGEITDSRGYKTNVSRITLDSSHFIDYIAPTITSVTLTRTEATSSTINVSIVGTFWNSNFGSSNNSITLSKRLKIDNGDYSSWSTITPTINGNNFTYTGTISVASTSTGILEIKVVDSTNTEYTLTGTVTKGKSLFDIGEDVLILNNNLALNGNFAINGEIQTSTKDSGWINSTTLETETFKAYNNNNSNMPKYRKIGKIVQVQGIVSPISALTASNTYKIFTLPSGYRPSVGITKICQGSGANIWLLEINTSGEAYISRYRNSSSYGSAAANAWLPFDVMFFVN